ncbi:MAG: Xaa-Pro aminopeptidase [Pseudomonadota bacterium]
MPTKTLRNERTRRRKNLMRAIGRGSIAIIPSAPVRNRNRSVDYPFRQDSDFYYLTGFNEPEAVAVLIPGRTQGEYLLFCRERDPEQETWHGRRMGIERAAEMLDVDDAFPIGDIDEILPGLIEGNERVHYSMGQDKAFDAQLMGWVNQVRAQRGHVPNEFVSLDHVLHEMRLFKTRAEIGLIRKAAKVSAAAHIRAMKACKPGMMEYELEAEYQYEFRRNGCGYAYPPIIGGGENGCILHYTENNMELSDGDLVLIDAGAEYYGYAGDITRTFPVNGAFSEPQRELYELVLESQLAAIKKACPGNHWNDPHTAAVRVLTKGMMNLGLLKGGLAENLREHRYRPFYMHRTGHWLGMDVHDVGDYKLDDEWRMLEPGMVLTIEPGLYVSPARGIPKRYHNIGIRIEDDVVITRDGCEILTKDVPKSVDEIEALMAA